MVKKNVTLFGVKEKGCKMFLGCYEHVIDAKNRLRIPPKFRKDMQQGMVILKGTDSALFLLPKDQFDNILNKVANIPMFDTAAQLSLRSLFSSALPFPLGQSLSPTP